MVIAALSYHNRPPGKAPKRAKMAVENPHRLVKTLKGGAPRKAGPRFPSGDIFLEGEGARPGEGRLFSGCREGEGPGLKKIQKKMQIILILFLTNSLGCDILHL